MMLLALADWGLGAYTFCQYRYDDRLGYFWAGLAVDLGLSFLLRLIAYSILASKWEGYYGKPGLKLLHVKMILIVSQFPYGDFLLHLGYRQIGYRDSPVLEPYPEDFTLPKHQIAYKGYLGKSTRGGHFYFLLMGYMKCLTQAIRLSIWIAGLVSMFAFFDFVPEAHTVIVILGGHLFLCICLFLKLLIENVNCKSIKIKNRYRGKKEYTDLLSDSFDNTQGIF